MILFFYMSSISAQEKYSVDEFLKQITKTKQFPIKKIDEKKLEWTEDDIFCDREITSCNRSIRNNCAKIYLSEKDFSSIESQYLALSDSLWNMEEINSFKIIDNKKIKKIDKKNDGIERSGKNYYYAFSTPLFSIDGNYVIIQERFCCGFLCADHCTILYKRDIDGKSWKKVCEWGCFSF